MQNFPKINQQTNLQFFNNVDIYNIYFARLKLLCESMFKWEGLEETCGIGSEKFLEDSLFHFGRACFVKDDKLGYLVLKANPSDYLNVYNMPLKINAYSNNYNKEYNFDDIVYIANNRNFLPTFNIVDWFSKKLSEIELTILINIIAQKTPVILTGTKEQALTLKNLYMQYAGNIPFIFGDKSFNLKGAIQSVSTEAPFIADKLTDIKHDTLNEFLTFIGVNNANTDKRERLNADEVNSNTQEVFSYLYCFYQERKNACKQINDKFFNGEEKIKVKINNEIFKQFLDETFIIDNEGDNNGEIYD